MSNKHPLYSNYWVRTCIWVFIARDWCTAVSRPAGGAQRIKMLRVRGKKKNRTRCGVCAFLATIPNFRENLGGRRGRPTPFFFLVIIFQRLRFNVSPHISADLEQDAAGLALKRRDDQVWEGNAKIRDGHFPPPSRPPVIAHIFTKTQRKCAETTAAVLRYSE